MSAYAASAAGKARCLALKPQEDLDQIKKNLKITTEAQKAYSMSGNSLPIGEIPDLSEAGGKLKNKLTLGVDEIRDVFAILTTGRLTKAFLNRFAPEESLLALLRHFSPRRSWNPLWKRFSIQNLR